jgi:hypothetical protein
MRYVTCVFVCVNRQEKLHSFFCREITSTHGGCFSPVTVRESKMQNNMQIECVSVDVSIEMPTRGHKMVKNEPVQKLC